MGTVLGGFDKFAKDTTKHIGSICTHPELLNTRSSTLWEA
jgi:hypothetical protein